MNTHAHTLKAKAIRKLAEHKTTFRYQLVASLLVVCAYGGTFVVDWLWPNFFVYPYLLTGISFGALSSYWPLLLWLVFLIGVDVIEDGWSLSSTDLDNKLLTWDLITSNMAALWEEFGYRYAFICYAMLSLVVVNWLLGSFIIWILIGVMGIAAVTVLVGSKEKRLFAIVPLSLSVGLYQLVGVVDPLFWVYEYIIMPLVNLLSFGSFTGVYASETSSGLFIMGGILANTWFRDGHKYQGPVGFLNSWVVGFVLLYTMMTHGLLTAVVLHGLWNTTLAVLSYMRRKI